MSDIKRNPLALSLSLIKENFKMYWYLPALTFFAYFFGGIFPIITNKNTPETIEQTVIYALNNLSVVYIPLLIICPLIAACIVMSVYHNQSRSLFMHAQPYSKSRLFNSQVVSGWLMLILPIIATALLYMIFKGEIYTMSMIGYWLFDSIVIMTFFFGMFVLAGSLVGTTIMQILLSGVMFGIVPLIVVIVSAYETTFLDGYAGSGSLADSIICNSNPVFKIVDSWGGEFTTGAHLAYLAAGIIMLVLARVAYQKAKLEKVGDSMMFGIIEELITYLIVFVGMTGFGFVLYMIAGCARSMLTLGLVMGALATFLVVKIIIAKSIKVFNKRNFKSLAIYLVIAVIFTSVYVYDITGFATRLPDRDKIEAVSLSTSTFGSTYNPMYSCDDVLLKDSQTQSNIKDPDAIDAMLELEKYIVENDKYQKGTYAYSAGYYTEDTPYYENVEYEYIDFAYKLKGGKTFARTYTVYLDDQIKEMINGIVTSDAWHDFYSYADRLDLSNVKDATLNVYSYDDYILYDDEDSKENAEATADTAMPAALPVNEDGMIIDCDTIIKLVEAHDKDWSKATYYYMRGEGEGSNYTEYDVNIYANFKEKSGQETYSAGICFEVRNTDANTIAALKEIGALG